MARTVKTIVEEVLGFQRTSTLWTANYYPAFPLTPQDFDIGALLPAMLYMARWGHRRGKGKFVSTFGPIDDSKAQPPWIVDVVDGLLARPDSALEGFEGEVGQTVLGDLLLAWCLENKKHAEGHKEQVQRIFPTHYLASWIDLPTSLAHLRGAPELLTSILANQEKGEWLDPGPRKTSFPVGVTHAENNLLSLFGRHMLVRGGYASDLASDTFSEESATDIGIDELLAVRLAQACGSAPLKAKGKNESDRIPNRHPIAKRAADFLRDDLAIFIEVYGESIPRQAFLQMLEAGIGLGLTNLTLSTMTVLVDWEHSGQVPEAGMQNPLPLFVDTSHGQDKALRELSESIMTEAVRRYERFPLLMTLLRVLDDRTRNDRKLRNDLPQTYPDSSAFINLLGDIYQERHKRAEAILDALDEDCQRLAEGLEAEGESPEIMQELRNGKGSAALRLAEALCELMGDRNQRQNYIGALESTLMTDRPNGLAIKRRVRRSQNGMLRSQDLRTVVLTPPLLDFLVHRHLRKSAKGKPYQPLSFQGFLKILRERYGLYVDRDPPGHPIPQELLLRNKAWLERRLRDLGLLMGVNDAESMKQLKPRYEGESKHVA
jgi:hypothetical protein